MNHQQDPANPEDAAALRRRAEAQLEREQEPLSRAHLSSTADKEVQRLLYELRVHQVELELQNHALREIRHQLEQSLERYVDLYDFSPVAIFTLTADGTIREVNLAGAELLGQERTQLLDQRFGPFVAANVRLAFNAFLERVAKGVARATCEVAITPEGASARQVQLQGVGLVHHGDRLCRIALLDITERTRLEDRLQKSETLLRTIVENTGDGINLLDLETRRYVFMNPAQVALTGFTAEEINNISAEEAYERVHPDDRELSVAQQRQVAVGNEPQTVEYRWKVKSGEYRWFSDTRKFVRDAQGRITALVGIARDITEYQRAEQAGRDSLTRLNEAQQAAHIGSWESDRVQNRVWWSEELYRLFEMDPAQASPPSREEFWGQRIHPDDQAAARAAYDQAIAHHTRFCVHGRLLFADGRIKYIEMMGSAEYAADGAVERTHGTIQDITSRKEAEQAIQALNAGLEQRVAERTAALAAEIAQRQQVEEQLREREDLLRLFIDRAPAALAMFDREMRYLAVSRCWLDDYALGERNILGLSHYEVFPEIPERWKAVHQRALAGETIRADEDRFERADGRRQWLRWEVLPWRKRDEAVGGIVIFSEDITARRQVEEEIRQFRTMVVLKSE